LLDETLTLPLCVIHGRRPGPKLFVCAALHGDEIVGVEIVRRLIRRRYRGLAGTLVLVPVANQHGFLAHDRYLPDRRDLNRSFPGRQRGSLTARLARLLFDEVVRRSNYGIDLHAGSGFRGNLPQLRVNLEDPRAAELALAFAPPVVIDAKYRPGSLRAAAAEYGIPLLVYEAGEALRVASNDVRVGIRGVLGVMRSLGMLPNTEPVRPQRSPFIARRSRWLRAPRSGLFVPQIELGSDVATGAILGTIEGILGDVQAELIADQAGVVIGLRSLPPVREGEALINLAQLDGSAGAPPDFEEDDTWEELD
jgi:predicted deacylase